MWRKIVVNTWDIYNNFKIIEEVDPLKTPSWENKRNFKVECLNCWNKNYLILLNHLRQRDIPSCDKCNWKNIVNSEEFLNKDNNINYQEELLKTIKKEKVFKISHRRMWLSFKNKQARIALRILNCENTIQLENIKNRIDLIYYDLQKQFENKYDSLKYIESLKKPVSICAWCYNKTEKEKEALEKWFSVTHRICEECAKKYFD